MHACVKCILQQLQPNAGDNTDMTTNPSLTLPGFAFQVILLVAGCCFTVWFASSGYSWTGMSPATCMPDHCFCEHIGAGTIRQWANSWSCVAFVAVAVWILWKSWSGQSHLRPVYTTVYAWCIAFLGFGSFYYHASLTFFWQWFDMMGMYLVCTYLVLYRVSRWRQWPAWVWLLSFLFFNAILGYVQASYPPVRRFLFGGFVALTALVEMGARTAFWSPTSCAAIRNERATTAPQDEQEGRGSRWKNGRSFACSRRPNTARSSPPVGMIPNTRSPGRTAPSAHGRSTRALVSPRGGCAGVEGLT